MLNYTNILFDFDGTICDTSAGIFASMEKVCDYYGLPFGHDTFVKMIGPSLEEGFTRFFQLSQSEIQNAVNIYREYYSAEGMFICEPYPEIKELVTALRASGKRVFVATSKPEVYTKKIMEHKGLLNLFDFVGGSDIEEKIRFNKADVINYVLSENSLSDRRDTALMIGDRFYDINGAHSAGLGSMGVLWGFGDRTELEQSGADYICETVAEVKDLLLM